MTINPCVLALTSVDPQRGCNNCGSGPPFILCPIGGLWNQGVIDSCGDHSRHPPFHPRFGVLRWVRSCN